ncbi:MAG: Wzz/FepE/Etk N-terminal domain-containing protein [Herbaspirillum sp.]
MPLATSAPEQSQTSQSPQNSDDDVIDLAQIVAFLRRNWGLITLTTLILILAALALFAFLPSRWQAVATLEVGQMPTATTVGASNGLIEPTSQAAERMKQRELINQTLTRLAIPSDQSDNPKANLFRNTLKPTIVKNTNFIHITVEAHSIREAQDNLTAAAQTLIDVHQKLMAPILHDYQVRLKDNEQQLLDAKSSLVATKATVGEAGHSTSNTTFSSHIVAVAQLADREKLVDRIQTERRGLQDVINPSRTFPTRIIDAVYVNPKPSFPKLPLFLAVGVLLGLAFGFVLALLREARQRAKAAP